MKYLKYLSYVIRHKWFVFCECCSAGLFWRGIIHDWSKLLPSEFFPYAKYFYGNYKSIQEFNGDVRNKYLSSGCYKERIDEKFDFAWLLHQKRNRHHWQWWLLREDNGGVKILDMQPKYRCEMFCDWLGAGRAQRAGPVWEWYDANMEKMQLSEDTRIEIDYMVETERFFYANREGNTTAN